MHYYTDVIRKYTVFDGRASRKEYWMFVLVNTLVAFAVGIAESMLGLVSQNGVGVLFILYTLFVILPSVAVGIRRLHDTGHSGWWFLILLVPLVGFIVFLLFLVIKGTPGPNEYGPDPLQETVSPSAANV